MIEHKKILIAWIVVLLIAGIGAWAVQKYYFGEDEVIETNAVQQNSEIPDWKTYRYEKYGLEFQYPTSWEVDSQETGEIFLYSAEALKSIGPMTAPTITIHKIELSDSLEDFVKKDEDGWYNFYAQKINKKIAGKDAIIVDDSTSDIPSAPMFAAFIKIDSSSILVVTGDYDIKNEFDQILSTIKFMEPTNTSTWKTYRNEDYGFEFKYPADWTVDDGRLYYGDSGPIVLYDKNDENEIYFEVRQQGYYEEPINYVCPYSIHEIECRKVSNNFGINYIRVISTGQFSFSSQEQLDAHIESKMVVINANTLLTDKSGKPYSGKDATTLIFDGILSTFKFIR